MNEDKMYEMLMNIMQKLAVVEAKLDTLEEIKIDAKTSSGKIEKLEMQNERHEKQLNALENRSNTMEQFVRNNMADTKKTQTNMIISVGIAIFSAIVSVMINFL